MKLVFSVVIMILVFLFLSIGTLCAVYRGDIADAVRCIIISLIPLGMIVVIIRNRDRKVIFRDALSMLASIPDGWHIVNGVWHYVVRVERCDGHDTYVDGVLVSQYWNRMLSPEEVNELYEEQRKDY